MIGSPYGRIRRYCGHHAPGAVERRDRDQVEERHPQVDEADVEDDRAGQAQRAAVRAAGDVQDVEQQPRQRGEDDVRERADQRDEHPLVARTA
jgi:hypothetical protein